MPVGVVDKGICLRRPVGPVLVVARVAVDQIADADVGQFLDPDFHSFVEEIHKLRIVGGQGAHFVHQSIIVLIRPTVVLACALTVRGREAAMVELQRIIGIARAAAVTKGVRLHIAHRQTIKEVRRHLE